MTGIGMIHGTVRPAAPRRPGRPPSLRRTIRRPTIAFPRLKPLVPARNTWFTMNRTDAARRADWFQMILLSSVNVAMPSLYTISTTTEMSTASSSEAIIRRATTAVGSPDVSPLHT